MKNCSANSNTEIGFHSLFNVSALNGRLENCSAKDNGSKSFDFESMNNNIQVTGDMILESAEL
ncbi:MAG: hypothetical protein KAR79_05005, partial [Simkaniaceae bacterium]|nr:hypothetical protein [Simkaniaceae bacterium]